jgi:hypothetical protein
MSPAFLVPETEVHANGHGAALPVDAEAVQLTLFVQKTFEQQSLEVLIEGSPDGETWAEAPLAAFPQKFYTGTYTLLCSLASHKEIKFLRAHWKVNRWGRGSLQPHFAFVLFMENYCQTA